MTLTELVENTYQSSLGLEDKPSKETCNLLKHIRLQITSDKYNRSTEELLDSHVARILERNIENLQSYLFHESAETVESANIRISVLESMIPAKLTKEELTTEMQNIKTMNPNITLSEMYIQLDHLYFDFNLVDPVLQTINQTI
jgi:hypothetical protein